MATIKTKFYQSNVEVFVIREDKQFSLYRDGFSVYARHEKEDAGEYLQDIIYKYGITLTEEEVNEIINEMDSHEWFAEPHKKYAVAMYLEQHQPMYVCDITSYQDGGSVDLNENLMFDSLEDAEAVKKEIEDYVVNEEGLELKGWGFQIEEIEFPEEDE